MTLSATVRWIAALATILLAAPVQAKVVTRTIEYPYNGMTMKGFLAYDDGNKAQRPGVLVVHEWWGLNDYIRDRVKQVADLGYVAFAPDMYGGGNTTRDAKEASAWSDDVQAKGELAPRAKAGLDVLLRQPQVDKTRIGAMGFCFGGSTVLALAYSGADLRGVVTFHGGLFPPTEAQRTQIKAPIAILQGEKDPFVTPEAIAQVKQALDAGKVDWFMVTYAGAVHAFTNPEADSFNIPGIAYNEKAATRSWQVMKDFFQAQLGR